MLQKVSSSDLKTLDLQAGLETDPAVIYSEALSKVNELMASLFPKPKYNIIKASVQKKFLARLGLENFRLTDFTEFHDHESLAQEPGHDGSKQHLDAFNKAKKNIVVSEDGDLDLQKREDARTRENPMRSVKYDDYKAYKKAKENGGLADLNSKIIASAKREETDLDLVNSTWNAWHKQESLPGSVLVDEQALGEKPGLLRAKEKSLSQDDKNEIARREKVGSSMRSNRYQLSEKETKPTDSKKFQKTIEKDESNILIEDENEEKSYKFKESSKLSSLPLSDEKINETKIEVSDFQVLIQEVKAALLPLATAEKNSVANADHDEEELEKNLEKDEREDERSPYEKYLDNVSNFLTLFNELLEQELLARKAKPAENKRQIRETMNQGILAIMGQLIEIKAYHEDNKADQEQIQSLKNTLNNMEKVFLKVKRANDKILRPVTPFVFWKNNEQKEDEYTKHRKVNFKKKAKVYEIENGHKEEGKLESYPAASGIDKKNRL